MTKAPILTELQQLENRKKTPEKRHQNFDYTKITEKLIVFG